MSVFTGLGGAYKQAEMAGDYRNLPDGDHVVKIVKAEGKISQANVPIIVWTLEAKMGEEVVQVQKTNYLNDTGFPFLKRDIKGLGIDPDNINMDHMDLWLGYFAGAYVNARATTTIKGDKTYSNIYFNSLYAPIQKEKPDTSKFQAVEDELPF